MSVLDVMHSQVTDEHGTPIEYIELARTALGGIDLDPATDSYWNHHCVKARRFYSKRENGLVQPWGGRVFLNSPGDVKGERTGIVSKFWRRLIEHYSEGKVDSAVWIGFSLQQLQTLQSSPMHPLQFVTLFPDARMDFLKRVGNGPPVKNGSPPHANFVTLLPTRASRTHAAQQVRAFVTEAKKLSLGGALTRPL